MEREGSTAAACCCMSHRATDACRVEQCGVCQTAWERNRFSVFDAPIDCLDVFVTIPCVELLDEACDEGSTRHIEGMQACLEGPTGVTPVVQLSVVLYWKMVVLQPRARAATPPTSQAQLLQSSPTTHWLLDSDLWLTPAAGTARESRTGRISRHLSLIMLWHRILAPQII